MFNIFTLYILNSENTSKELNIERFIMYNILTLFNTAIWYSV